MRKQILTLAMCLALTATTAFANGTNVSKTKTPLTPTKPAVNTVVPVAPGTNVGKPCDPSMSRDIAKKRFEDRRTKEREQLYNSLNLSPEQRVKAESLDVKTRAEAAKYIKKVQMEAKKLRDLKAQHASFFDIYKQKYALKLAKVEAGNYFKESRKSFEAILTDEQKAKFKSINEAKRKDMEKFKKNHKRGRHGMGPGRMNPYEGGRPNPPEGVGPNPLPSTDKK